MLTQLSKLIRIGICWHWCSREQLRTDIACTLHQKRLNLRPFLSSVLTILIGTTNMLAFYWAKAASKLGNQTARRIQNNQKAITCINDKTFHQRIYRPQVSVTQNLKPTRGNAAFSYHVIDNTYCSTFLTFWDVAKTIWNSMRTLWTCGWLLPRFHRELIIRIPCRHSPQKPASSRLLKI